ncbi:MAG: cation diffusion facilitator family transporter [Magnetospirillum sp. WYHS-4]
MKVGAWAATSSVSVLTSLMDSVLDNSVALLNFLAVRQAVRQADRFHRFGFGKVEPLASLVESVFLVGVAIMIVIEAIDRFGHPHSIARAEWGIGAMAGVIVLTGGLVLYQRHVVRLTGSLILRADSVHYSTDILTHLGIILSLALSGLGGLLWVDALFALGIAIYLAWNARSIFIDALGALLDRELCDEERHKIRNLALSHPEVHGVHDLRTRSSGDRLFIQLHVEMAPDLPLRDAHRYAEETIDVILAAYPNAEVQVHEEPVGMPRHRSWCRQAGLPTPEFAGEYGGIPPEPGERREKPLTGSKIHGDLVE